MNKEQFIKEFKDAVNEMKTQKHPIGTYYWILQRENGLDWAIVLGWNDGFDCTLKDEYLNGTYRLCAKFAHQSSKSIMQCDYVIDWFMPYNEESGYVDDTEVSIYTCDDLDKTADYLWNCYLYYFGEKSCKSA